MALNEIEATRCGLEEKPVILSAAKDLVLWSRHHSPLDEAALMHEMFRCAQHDDTLTLLCVASISLTAIEPCDAVSAINSCKRSLRLVRPASVCVTTRLLEYFRDCLYRIFK